ncbi:hypothetical protein B0H15DRAFT_857912 [Mycena belliarum]|uniref:Uncharacterized protein n=1 Tax=Mycena belliarum TaxID=1033014 RepID=A0AAD6TYH4_9AGAR|nr:hypothetical protein B0H15DRAFT_857912 [Mycena belliae]
MKQPRRFWKTRMNSRESRNPGRRDRLTWNGNAFICPADIDGFRYDARDTTAAAPLADEDDFRITDAYLHFEPTRVSRHEVEILDIARKAKPKGTAKRFEMIETPCRIIELDADVFLEGVSFTDDNHDASEWEDIADFYLSDDDESLDGANEYSLVKLDNEQGRVQRHTEASGARRKAYADVLRAGVGG